MEKLKLFSREQVGNAPLTGRQYSRPDSLSLVSRQSVLAFLLVLLTTVFGVGNAWGEEYTYTFSSFDQGSPVEFTVADPALTITLTVAASGQGNSTKPQWNAGSSQARVYAGGKLSIAIEEATIEKIEFDYVVNASSGTSPSITGVEGSTNAGTWTANTKTWEGSDSEVIFSTSGTKGNVGFKSFKVYYTSLGSGSEEPAVSVEQVTLDKSNITLTVDETQTLEATVSPDNASNKNVTWESSDETVATVSNAGLVTAVGTGDATITCKSVADDTKFATCAVHVNASLYTKSTLNFTAACGGSGTASDGVEWIVTSDGSESSFDNAKGIHYGTSSGAVQYIQLATSDIEGTIAKVVVNASTASGVSATASVTIGGDAFGGDAQSLSTSAAEYTFTGSASGEIVVLVTKPSSATKAIYVKSIVVYYIPAPQKTPAGLAYNDADLSNLVKLSASFTAPTLANPNSLSVAYESSNTDVAEVASNGALTIKAVGVAEITASSAETETYKAGSAKYTIYVVAHDGTEDDPYTVADARVIIDKVGETGIADQYAKGIVSEIVTAYNSQYGNISYNISDDGTTTSAQLQAFRGKGIDGENFTSEDDIMVGDEVVVKGLLKKYNSTYEFNADNQLVSLNRTKTAAGLAYAETAVEKNISDAAFTNALTNPNNLEVSYSSSATGVATVDENGEVTIVGMGTTTIKATFAGNASYLAEEVSYTLTVNDPSLTKVTFDATIDKTTEDNELSITKGDLTIEVTSGRFNNGTDYRVYKNAVFTVSCATGNIKRMELTCTSGNTITGFGEATGLDKANSSWIGDATSVELTASGAQVRIEKLVVYYAVDARAAAGLAYETTAIVKHVGDDAFVNTLTNPNNLMVAYESSNTEVAEVANDGNVTIKAEGSTTITASFDGDEDYKPASVSYVLTVNEAGLENVTFDATIDVAETGLLTLSKGGFTLTFTDGAMSNSENYRLYKGQTMTLSSTDYIIKKIEFTCSSGNPVTGFGDATGLDKTNSRWTGEANKVELTASSAQVRIEKMVVYYVEDTRAASGLAWSTDAVEITLGDDFTAASLVNPNSIDVAEILIESSNTDLATITAGVVELVADATGTATITATFEGNATYKPAEFSYTITVNDPTPVIYVSKLNVNFAPVEVGDAVPAAETVTVTLTNVASVTATLGGTNADAFSVSPASLTESGDITISILANTDAAASYSATLTISDGAEGAEDKTINLSFAVTEPVVEDDVTGTWTLVTNATTLAAGKKVIIAQYVEADGAINTMAGQATNNRSVIASTVAGATLTPTVGTKVMTLADAGEGHFYLQTSDGEYLYNASTSSKSYLRTKAEEENVSWTIAVDAEGVATITSVENTNRTKMRYNPNTSGSPLFNCYASGQEDIALYMLEEDTPEPAADYTRDVKNGNYGTICLPQAGTITGATLFEIASFENGMIYMDEVGSTMEAGKPYIFQATADQLNVTYTSGAQVAAGKANGLYGFYNLSNMATDDADKLDLEEDKGNYILYQNAYWLVSGREAYINNFRAYIKLGEISTTATEPVPGAAPRRRVAMAVHGEQVATGVDQVPSDQVTSTKVLINGQLFILRGEKMYDVTGKLVK